MQGYFTRVRLLACHCRMYQHGCNHVASLLSTPRIPCRYERAHMPDGRRINRWYLLDQHGSTHLAVIGIERDTKDGHYTYSAVRNGCPVFWSCRGKFAHCIWRLFEVRGMRQAKSRIMFLNG